MSLAEVFQRKIRTSAYALNIAVLILSGFVPLLFSAQASADQLTSRKVTLSTSVADATNVQYDFTFSWGTATDVEGVLMQFCTTPLGTCTLPTDMDVSNDTVALDAHTNFPTNSTSFTEVSTNTGDCNDTGSAATVTMYCISRTEAASATGSGATIDLSGIVNPSLSSAYTSVYVRVSLYDNASFTGPAVHEGTVAASINQQLTINGRVQERLSFCVAAIEDGGATDTTLPTSVANCASETNTVVDLGVIDNSDIARSPVDNNPPTSQGNDRYGIAMLNTNASGGTAVTYFAEPDSTGTNQLRAFRVPGATCNASAATLTDQCFQSSSNTAFSAGTENFGVNIPCIIAYDGGPTVNGVSTTTASLSAAADYDNADADTSPDADCENDDTGNTYSWNDTTSAVSLASATSPVDNEIIKLNFAATASGTTPTGSYTVISTYIATPTF